MKIALLQTPVVDNKEVNLQTACAAIQSAAEQGADLAVLPEMFNCPYSSDYFKAYAEEEGGYSWRTMAACAAKNHIGLVAGSMPELDNSKVYNTSYVFDRGGRQITKHRKMHLFDINIPGGQYFCESDTFTPGDQVTTFTFDNMSFGLCICFDFRFPDLSRLMSLRGVSAILVPAAFNMTTGPLHWETMFRQRAIDDQVYTVGVAPARDENGVYVSYANSIACSPMGKIIVRAETQPTTLYVTIDQNEVVSVRQSLPLLSARRTDIYAIHEVNEHERT